MYNSWAASQWNKSRGKVCCQILRVFSFCFCSHELSQGTDTQFLLQLLDSRLFVNEEKKKSSPELFSSQYCFSELKNGGQEEWLRGTVGLIKHSFAKKKGGGRGKKGNHSEVIVFETFPLQRTTVVVFLNYVVYTVDVSVEERRNLS